MRDPETGGKVGNVNKMDSDYGLEEGGRLCEFVAVARRQVPEFPAVVVALQVRWEDGVAYRVNVGGIAEETWMEVQRRAWKLVALM